MNGRSILHSGRQVVAIRKFSSQVQQLAHARPTGQLTFVKGQPEKGSKVVQIWIGVGAALTATVAVGTLLFNSKKQTTSNGLRPDRYEQFEVLSAGKTSSPSQLNNTSTDEHVYLKINAPLSKEVIREGLQSSNSSNLRILSIFIKEPSLQIERPYTPLYSDALDGLHPNTPLELLIKRYPDGELGKYAHRLNGKAQVELRGPTVTWAGSQPDHFVLIVGGTGITPAYQLLNTVFSRNSHAVEISPKALPKFTIIYGASKPSSFLLLPELAALQKEFPKQIDIRLRADQLDKETSKSVSWLDWVQGRTPQLEGMDLSLGQIDEKSVRSALESSEKDHDASRRILVCGPDGMIAHIAGSKQGKLQGPLGGILSALKCTEEEVWKL